MPEGSSGGSASNVSGATDDELNWESSNPMNRGKTKGGGSSTGGTAEGAVGGRTVNWNTNPMKKKKEAHLYAY